MILPINNPCRINYNSNNRNNERAGSKEKKTKVLQSKLSYNDSAFEVVFNHYMANPGQLYNAQGIKI